MSITNKVSNKSVMPGITAVPDVVDAPTIGSATAGAEEASVTFTAAVTGGAATSFTAISTPGSITGSSATSPITVTGLTAGTGYTFKVYGANSSGTWSAIQSSASNSVTPTVATSYDSIATTTVGAGGTSSVTFSSIPSTYAHLQIRLIALSGSAGTNLEVRFNSDTANNYDTNWIYGTGASITTGIATGISYSWGAGAGSSTAPAGVIIDILDYANTNKFKTVRNLGGFDVNGSGGYAYFTSGLWRSTNAITSIKIDVSGTTFSQYSSFALYGIKSA